jgi:hypothetical protein
MQRKQAERPSGWLAIKFQMAGVKYRPLLTHCINPRPLNFLGLDIQTATLMNMGILYGAGKVQAEIRRKLLHVTLHKFAPIFNQATDLPRLNFNVTNILDRNSGRKNGGKTRSRYEATDFPPVSLV